MQCYSCGWDYVHACKIKEIYIIIFGSNIHSWGGRFVLTINQVILIAQKKEKNIKKRELDERERVRWAGDVIVREREREKERKRKRGR